jgi:hypothetical protein
MKRIIESLLGVMLFVSLLQAQSNVSATVGTLTTFYRDSLTVDKDTITVTFTSPFKRSLNFYTITVQSSVSDDDTLLIYTQSADALEWVLAGVKGITTGTYGTSIITSQTWTEYELTDPQPFGGAIRITRASDDASVPRIIVTGKRKSSGN